MPGSCEVIGCKNNSLMRVNRPSFHRFPKDLERRNRWIIALRRKRCDQSPWKPSPCARICGGHFIQGKPNNDPYHPDYVPTLFPYNKKDRKYHKKKRLSVSRYERRHKRSQNTQALNSAIMRVNTGLQITERIKKGSSHTAEGQPQLPTNGERGKEAVWLYTIQDSKIRGLQLCRRVNRPPLSAIMKFNLLQPSSSSAATVATTPGSATPVQTTPVASTPVATTPGSTTPVQTAPVASTPVVSILATNSSTPSAPTLDTNDSTPTLVTESFEPPAPKVMPTLDTNDSVPTLVTESFVQPAPKVLPTLDRDDSSPTLVTESFIQPAPKVMPPCTKSMLFDEITALRSERDKALSMVTELQQKVKLLKRKLKNKSGRLQKHNPSLSHRMVHKNTSNSQENTQ